ncbi:phage tail terminator family protein [Desulfosporosinus youngiae]|uniref:Phage protein n=1 Tax=Desulfosporosinus youngiae DSM 17734 TaxID=768710 RepID=H5Y2M1_9FIRM|nr:hypothetical protein [Desulfosporosinus youngiae]EHQ88284.1 hypothetical protein DesyoDRAFT_1114 [Desulfosporosinus youngiae DSM 17734]
MADRQGDDDVITVNLVRDSVMSALDQHFPEIKVHGEEIRQGFKKPCFFVKLFPASQDQLLGRRYQRSHSFDIHYFDGSNEDLHDMAEQLYDKMELISADGGPIRGTGMRHEVVDGVLHFFVNYNFHVQRSVEPDPLMQTMEQEGYVRG